MTALPSSESKADSESVVTHEIEIRSFGFHPKEITVKVGDLIRWTNVDLAPHTATAKQESWDTGEIVKGQSKSVLVTSEMGEDYFCAYHPHMRGVIKLS